MERETADRKSTSAVHKLLLIAFALFLLSVAIYGGFYFAIVRPSMQLPRDLAREFRDAFNFTPRITIDDTTVIEQNTPILELATSQRDVFQRHQWEHTWAGSTKRIVLEGSFTAKAGYDLQQPFVISVRSDRLHVTLPKPQLLSFQLKEYRVVQDEDGWWNRITPQERTSAFQALQESAQRKAAASGIVIDAQRNFEERLHEFAAERDVQVEITHRAASYHLKQ
jgi:hypothetical protein